MTQTLERLRFPPSTALLYVVAYDSTQDLDEPYEPVIIGGPDFSQATRPHGLSLEMSHALAGVRYCLHLPMAVADFLDLPAAVLRYASAFPLAHRIAVVPAPMLADFAAWSGGLPLAMICCADDAVPTAEVVARDHGALLPVLPFSKIEPLQVEQDWRLIAAALGIETALPPLVTETLSPPLLGSALATRRLARQMGWDLPPPPTAADEAFRHWVGWNWNLRAAVNAVADVESMEASSEPPEVLLEQRAAESPTTSRLSIVVLGGLGASSRYAGVPVAQDLRRIGAPDCADPDEEDFGALGTDRRLERGALELMVTHRAVAHDGVGLVLPDVPPEAFHILRDLEAHWRGPGGPRPRSVNRLLAKLNIAMAPVISDDVAAAITRSDRAKIYSNFPFGLLTIPGGSAPLGMRISVSQSPLIPMTRMFASELIAPRTATLSRGFTVLIAECISESDPVGQAARIGWAFMEKELTSSDIPVKFHRRQVRSARDFRRAVAETSPDLLILCAHGHHLANANAAGVMLGDEFTLGTDLGDVPPVVLLSACSVTPRGATEVTIADLLLRQGAIAVLGAAVPVDVRHNATLYFRFILYITLSLKGQEPEADLLSIWHRVQAGNAVNDVISGNGNLHAWTMYPHLGMKPPLTAFMTDPQPSIRLADIYADTEATLLRIAEARGMRARMDGWLRNPGYVPESAMYVFLGDPECVQVKEPEI